MSIPIVGNTSTPVTIYPLQGDPGNVTQANQVAIDPAGVYGYWYDSSAAKRVVRQRLSDNDLTVLVSGYDMGSQYCSAMVSQDGLYVYFSGTDGILHRMVVADNSIAAVAALSGPDSPGQISSMYGWYDSNRVIVTYYVAKEIYILDVTTAAIEILFTTQWWPTRGDAYWDAANRLLYISQCRGGPGNDAVIVRFDIDEGQFSIVSFGTDSAAGGSTADSGVEAYRQALPKMTSVCGGDGYLYLVCGATLRIRRINLSDTIDQTVVTFAAASPDIMYGKYLPIQQALIINESTFMRICT